jgi:hypothetical protein
VNVTNLGDPMSPSMTAATVYLAVQQPGSAYMTGWTATRAGDKWTVTESPSTAMVKRRASDFDSESVENLSGVNDGSGLLAASDSPAPAAPAPVTAAPTTPTAGAAKPGTEAPAEEAKLASEGSVKGHRPLELFMYYEITMRVLQRTKEGPPLPLELSNAMTKTFEISGIMLEREMEIGRQEAAEGRRLPPVELAMFVDGQVARFSSRVEDFSTDGMLAMVAGMSSRKVEDVTKDYDEGVKLKKK